METWQIVAIVGGSVFLAYGFSCVIFFSELTKFAHRIQRRLNAIDVLLAQKYELLRLIGKLFKKYNAVLPSDFEAELAPHFDQKTKDITGVERTTLRSYLLRITQTVYFYADQNKSLAKDTEFLALKKPLQEVDGNYRRAVANYNADVLGFNYWVDTFLWKWVGKVARLKHKDIIS